MTAAARVLYAVGWLLAAAGAVTLAASWLRFGWPGGTLIVAHTGLSVAVSRTPVLDGAWSRP